MRKDTVLLIAGVLVFITPFLGIPESWKAILLYVLGIVVLLGALMCRLHARMAERDEDEDTYHTDSDPIEKVRVVD